MKLRFVVILRIVALVAFSFTTLWLTFGFSDVFLSPDENANAQFAQTVAQERELCVHDEKAVLAGGLVHPRSTVVVGDCVVPGSFLGFPVLAGLAQSWFGLWGARLLTPFLALITLILLWDTLRRLTRDVVLADIASLLLMSAPPFWYYSARVMMHNVAFVALLTLGVWLLVVMRTRQSLLGFFFSGAATGLAIFVRAFEAPWVALLGLGSLLSVPEFRRVRPIAVWMLGCALPVACMLLLQWGTYGGVLATGYTVPSEMAVSPSSLVGEAVSQAAWYEFILPFGFEFKGILRNAWNYGFSLYPWMAIPAVAGLVLALRRPGAWRKAAIVSIALGVWLVVVYGSWTFADNPDPRAITLGNSHVRYWLPLFVLGCVFSALALRVGFVYLAKHHRTAARVALVGSLVASISLSLALVFFGGDGLVVNRKALPTFTAKREAILAVTENEAVIVVDRADKYLFPYRSVVVPLRSDVTYAALPELVTAGPVYYFGITFPSSDLEYLNSEKLATFGLEIELIMTVNEESLYRISAL